MSIGDPALIALRKAFSLTYPDEPTLESVKGRWNRSARCAWTR